MHLLVKYAYVIIIAMFAFIMFLVFSERIFTIQNPSYNLYSNLVIVAIFSVLILSTLFNAYAVNTDNVQIGTITHIFNSLASKNMIMFYGCVLYVLYISNTELYDNNYSHSIFSKIGLGKYISNRTYGVIMLLATVFITAKAIHSSTIHGCGGIIEENINDNLGQFVAVPESILRR